MVLILLLSRVSDNVPIDEISKMQYNSYYVAIYMWLCTQTK